MSKANPDYVLRAQLITQIMVAVHGEDLGSTSTMMSHMRKRVDGRVYGIEIDNISLVVDEIIKVAKR